MDIDGILSFATARPDGTVPFLLNNDWTGSKPRPIPVRLQDARPIAGQLSLGKSGFTIDRVVCGDVDFRNPEDVEANWKPAVRDMMRRVTGADFVTLFAGPLVRFSNSDPRSRGSSVSAPARAVHSDLWAEYGMADVAASPAPDDALRDLAAAFGEAGPRRWRIFNCWQMLSPPPQDTPLALCALDSVSIDDVLVGQGRFCPEGSAEPALPQPGEPFDAPITFFRETPRQRWYYFSDMLPGEALVFQTLDPEAGPLKGRVPHCAFDVSPVPRNVVGRNSIEIRAIVAYD